MTYQPSKESSHPVHERSMIRINDGQTVANKTPYPSSCAQRWLRIRCADSLADRSFCWSHISRTTTDDFQCAHELAGLGNLCFVARLHFKQSCFDDNKRFLQWLNSTQLADRHLFLKATHNPQRQICASSDDSDQPARSRSLIRIFTGHILDSQGCKLSSCGQRRL